MGEPDDASNMESSAARAVCDVIIAWFRELLTASSGAHAGHGACDAASACCLQPTGIADMELGTCVWILKRSAWPGC